MVYYSSHKKEIKSVAWNSVYYSSHKKEINTRVDQKIPSIR